MELLNVKLLSCISGTGGFSFVAGAIGVTKRRVSMGLTVSRKTAKNIAVRCKNERILTVSRKKI